jgi:signal transduction histidine kinase
MLARMASLRLWLLGAMIASACLGLAGAAVLYGHIERSHEQSADRAKAAMEARAVAAQVQAGAGLPRLQGLQQLLANDQLAVERAGRVIFRGPNKRGRDLELRVRVPFSGGVVTLADYTSPGSSTTVALTLITAGVLALVIGAAILAATLVSGSVRSPIARAIAAADRVARGDFGARMGASGPEELIRLGRAFDGMAARLERADSDQRQFLADVAHEIATPVNNVSGFALALADGTVITPEQRTEALAVIEADSRRLGELLTDLRELTRLDLADGVRLAQLTLTDLARELSARFGPTARAAGLTLALDVRPATITSDARLLTTIASNLLSNAIRYTPTGGHVRIRMRQRRGELIIAVHDTGVGIALEHQQRIFERLYRVDGTRDRATGGSGLGLAIAHRAAHTLGGRLEIDSEVDRGSEFRLIVPIRHAGEQPDDDSLASEHTRPTQARPAKTN